MVVSEQHREICVPGERGPGRNMSLHERSGEAELPGKLVKKPGWDMETRLDDTLHPSLKKRDRNLRKTIPVEVTATMGAADVEGLCVD